MLLTPNVPGVIIPIPWEGDGASIGIGNNASEESSGQMEMIMGTPTLNWPHAYIAPIPWKLIDLHTMGDYPSIGVGTAIMMAPPIPWGIGDYQDVLPPKYAANLQGDIQLGAPALPT